MSLLLPQRKLNGRSRNYAQEPTEQGVLAEP